MYVNNTLMKKEKRKTEVKFCRSSESRLNGNMGDKGATHCSIHCTPERILQTRGLSLSTDVMYECNAWNASAIPQPACDWSQHMEEEEMKRTARETEPKPRAMVPGADLESWTAWY